MEYLALASLSEFLCTGLVVAVLYFPLCWVAYKLGGEKLLNVAILGAVVGALALIFSVPVAFYLFIKYGL